MSKDDGKNWEILKSLSYFSYNFFQHFKFLSINCWHDFWFRIDLVCRKITKKIRNFRIFFFFNFKFLLFQFRHDFLFWIKLEWWKKFLEIMKIRFCLRNFWFKFPNISFLNIGMIFDSVDLSFWKFKKKLQNLENSEFCSVCIKFFCGNFVIFSRL